MMKKCGEKKQPKRKTPINKKTFPLNNYKLLVKMHPILQSLKCMHQEKRENAVEVGAAVAAMKKRKDHLKKNLLPPMQENNNNRNLQLILNNNNHNIPRIRTSVVAREEMKILKKNQKLQIVDFIFV